MLDIAPETVAHVIVRAREIDAKVSSWGLGGDEASPEFILQSRADDATEAKLRAFIAGLNIDKRVSLVALTWIGRGIYEPEESNEVKAVALAQSSNLTECYLIGIPLLADYVEEGLNRLGISVEAAEKGIL